MALLAYHLGTQEPVTPRRYALADDGALCLERLIRRQPLPAAPHDVGARDSLNGATGQEGSALLEVLESASAKAKENGTGACLARTEFYDRRRGRTKRTREDVSDERVAKATRKAEEGEVRAIKSAGRVTGTCRKWLQGCCQRVVTRDTVRRGHCRRAHGSDIPAIDTERASERDAEEVKASIAIVCMSVPGGPCYDSTYLCPFGTDACPYSHELLAPVITGPPAPGGEQA